MKSASFNIRPIEELVDSKEVQGNFLLITTRPGSEFWALTESLDALYPLDLSIEVFSPPIPGNILLKMNIPLEKAIRILAKRYTTSIYHVYPINVILRPSHVDQLIQACLRLSKNLIPSNTSFRVKCKRRGDKLVKNSEEFEKYLGEIILRNLYDKCLSVNLEKPDVVVMIHIISYIVGIGISKPRLILRKHTRWD